MTQTTPSGLFISFEGIDGAVLAAHKERAPRNGGLRADVRGRRVGECPLELQLGHIRLGEACDAGGHEAAVVMPPADGGGNVGHVEPGRRTLAARRRGRALVGGIRRAREVFGDLYFFCRRNSFHSESRVSHTANSTVVPGTLVKRDNWNQLLRFFAKKGIALIAHAWALIFGSIALVAWWPNPLTFLLAVGIIEGIAESNGRISSYIKSFEGSQWFTDPKLVVIRTSEKERQREGQFTLRVKNLTKAAKPADPAAAAVAPGAKP